MHGLRGLGPPWPKVLARLRQLGPPLGQRWQLLPPQQQLLQTLLPAETR